VRPEKADAKIDEKSFLNKFDYSNGNVDECSAVVKPCLNEMLAVNSVKFETGRVQKNCNTL
jgi:hypothetical protein